MVCGRTAMLALMITAAFAATAASGQEWPTKPVRLIAPFAPGGNTDTLARVIGQKLSERFGQQFYVENIAGNGGVLGSAAAQRSDPDGYTLLVSGLASHVIAPAFNTNVKYDPMGDFTHIAMLGGSPIVAVVNPQLGIKSLQALVDYAKKTTPPPPYSSSGTGSHAHLTAEYFQHLAGVKLSHVAYRGGGQAMTDLIGNHLSIGFNSLVATAQHIRAGMLIPLGMTAPERLDNFPDLPTFAELGYPQLSGTTWFSISGPKGVPDAIVKRLNAELAVILKQPDVKEKMKEDGLIPIVMDVPTLLDYYQSETKRWGPIVKAAGLKVE